MIFARPKVVGSRAMSRVMVNGWFILSVLLVTEAFIAGTCVAALYGNYAEWLHSCSARLAIPFIDHKKPIATFLNILLGGPYLIISEAIQARHEQHVGHLTTFVVLFFASLWCLASGILCLEFLWQITQHGLT